MTVIGRKGLCIQAIIIRVGVRMNTGWCPPVLGIRSGERMMRGWCPQLKALVLAAHAAAIGVPQGVVGGGVGLATACNFHKILKIVVFLINGSLVQDF